MKGFSPSILTFLASVGAKGLSLCKNQVLLCIMGELWSAADDVCSPPA